ncbi:MAG: hypothetical protein M1372_02925 [Patescibacteria group bacterium]|nr:hypothetical protein [Patescibacteria group bacterium]
MNNYRGVIIKESLEDKKVLKKVKIVSTKNEKVTEKHKTPWISQWTLHTVEIPQDQAKEIAEQISKSLDRNHKGSWYADFKNNTHHYIIFKNKVFFINRQNRRGYEEAKNYGISIGIPEYQLISPDTKDYVD